MLSIGFRYSFCGALALAFCSPVIAFAASPCPYVWSTNLSQGKNGPDVLKLQQFLNQDTATMVATTGQGSAGMETIVFGGMTKKAVIAFQDKYAADILKPNGLVSGNGFVGASTRAKLNALCSSGISASAMVASAATAVSAGLTVSIPEQPATTLAPSGALYVPFTNVTLTAGVSDVTINSITIERVGPASDSTLLDIDLFDDQGNFLGLAYFTADHTAVFRDTFTIPAGTSRILSVVGDMAVDLSGHDGEMAGLQVNAIDANAPVTGPLPVRGTFQTMNSTLEIGTATVLLSPNDPQTSRTKHINDTRITFSGIRVSAGNIEDLKLTSFAWKQNGSASPSDLANVEIVVDDVAYPAENDGRSYSAAFGDGILIRKGMSVNVSIRGDLTTTGSNRTVQFDIYDGGDIGLVGTMYGYGIFPIPEGNTGITGDNSVFLTEDGSPDTDSIRPYFAGSPTTVSAGSATYIGI